MGEKFVSFALNRFPSMFLSGNRKSKIQNRKWVRIFAIVATFVFRAVDTRAQQPGKVPRIGFLAANSPSSSAARVEAFRQGLHQLGYVEGNNIMIEFRYAGGQLDRLPALATELVRLKVNVIVTSGPAPTRPAKEATDTIPIVMAWDIDPVGSGFVSSLAHPGSNITGFSVLAPEISGKRLELLKETIPKLSRVAVFGSAVEPGNSQSLRETERAAKALEVDLQYREVGGAKEIEVAFQQAIKKRAEALLVLATAVNFSQRTQIASFALKSRIPAIYGSSEYADAGGLMTYGVNFVDLFRRAATYVDKILKGAKPAELPVEQPTKFEFVINLKAAKQIGLTIPPNVLARADRVIR
jgi:putative ABC transport system substrate-binding protein